MKNTTTQSIVDSEYECDLRLLLRYSVSASVPASIVDSVDSRLGRRLLRSSVSASVPASHHSPASTKVSSMKVVVEVASEVMAAAAAQFGLQPPLFLLDPLPRHCI